MATKIHGELKCIVCGDVQLDREVIIPCLKCNCHLVKHIPNPLIRLCPLHNVEGHGKKGGNLSKLSKQIILNYKNKKEVYNKIRDYMQTITEPQTSSDIIKILNIQGLTDGDAIRSILNLLVCEGVVKKEFMKKRKFHVFTPCTTTQECPYLQRLKSGKRIGTYICGFDYKKSRDTHRGRDFFGSGNQNQ